jgi:ribosomal protein S18 acetylase RimI-like enzyme
MILMNIGFTIEVLAEADDEVVEAFARLIPLLSTSAAVPDRGRVERVLGHAPNTVLAAKDSAGRIVGLLTLVVLELATGTEARVEDVVVDEAARGTGVGRGLVVAALEAAAAFGARYVDLTSAPRRVAARGLYRSLGFESRETGVFRHTLDTYRGR